MVLFTEPDTYKLAQWDTSGKNFFNEAIICYLLQDPRWNIKSYDVTTSFIEHMAVYKYIIKYLSNDTKEFWDFSKVINKTANFTKFFPYLLSKKKLVIKRKECFIIRDGETEEESFIVRDFSCLGIVNRYLVSLDNMSVHNKNLFVLLYYSISITEEYIILLYNIISSSDRFKIFFMTNLLYLLDVLEYEDIHRYSYIIHNEYKRVTYLIDIPTDNLLYELVYKIKKNMPEKDSPLKMIFNYLIYENIGEQLVLDDGSSEFFKFLQILLRNIPIEDVRYDSLYKDFFKSDLLYTDINSNKLYGNSFYFRILSNFNVLKDIIDKFINSQLFIINKFILNNDTFEFNGPPHLSRVTLEDSKKLYEKFDNWLEIKRREVN